jgi:hypothetical protein
MPDAAPVTTNVREWARSGLAMDEFLSVVPGRGSLTPRPPHKPTFGVPLQSLQRRPSCYGRIVGPVHSPDREHLNPGAQSRCRIRSVAEA